MLVASWYAPRIVRSYLAGALVGEGAGSGSAPDPPLKGPVSPPGGMGAPPSVAAGAAPAEARLKASRVPEMSCRKKH